MRSRCTDHTREQFVIYGAAQSSRRATRAWTKREAGSACCRPGCEQPKHITSSGVVKSRCQQHWQEQTAQMRARQRQRPTREMRACIQCGENFEWRSESPKQETCSKACYMARRFAMHGNKQSPERRNEQARRRTIARLAAACGMAPEEFEERRFGSCDICHEQAREPLHLDHDHATNALRGFLCQGCNHGLGHFRDDPALLWAALQYLIPEINGRVLDGVHPGAAMTPPT